MTLQLSLAQARKLTLQAQRVLRPNRYGAAVDATREAIDHLGYIQIDTISVVERAHHHTLWNRNPRYQQQQLDALQRRVEIFEYWAHAAAYLPIADYRMCLPNMARVKAGDALWFKADAKIKRKVLARIRTEGPLQSRDFENHGATRLPMWEWKPAKYALETLFMEGELMVAYREGFQKVYELRERVLPAGVDTRMPTPTEFADYLIFRFLDAHGFGAAAEIAYLRQGYKKPVAERLLELHEAGRIVPVQVAQQQYWMRPEALELLARPLARAKLMILSPFDNLVIQRNRIGRLFGFDYQVECYVPKPKRKWGYFCLPVLWNAALVARIDCRAARKSGVLQVRNLILEPKLAPREAFFRALGKSLQNFMAMNRCQRIEVAEVSNRRDRAALRAWCQDLL